MVQPTTLAFLRDLKANNEKPWFDAHKAEYLTAKDDFEKLTAQLLLGMGEHNPDIAGLQAKDCVFRIYKDVRFSKDKTPYKTHFAATIQKGGKKSHFPGFYFHIEPDGLTFCGGGIWHPAPTDLKKIRQEIDYNFDEFLAIITAPEFNRLFGKLEDGNALTRMPQGYPEGNPAACYLKMRNYVAGATFTDNQLGAGGFLKEALHVFDALRPFIDFLSRAMA